MKKLSVIVLGSLTALALAAQDRSSRQVFIGEEAPKDVKVLDTWLHIEHRSNEIFMQPLLPPHFKLALLGGDGAESDRIAKCGVYRHYMPPTADDKVIVVTVIKCGRNTYGISELDFQSDVLGDSPQQGHSNRGTPALR